MLEEIVGPIQDEHDNEEAQIKRTGDHQWLAEGRVSLYELAEVLRVALPEGGYETLGGFLIARAGRMLRTGDRVDFLNFAFTIVEADERKVSRVEIRKTAASTSTSETSDPSIEAPLLNSGDDDDDGRRGARDD